MQQSSTASDDIIPLQVSMPSARSEKDQSSAKPSHYGGSDKAYSEENIFSTFASVKMKLVQASNNHQDVVSGTSGHRVTPNRGLVSTSDHKVAVNSETVSGASGHVSGLDQTSQNSDNESAVYNEVDDVFSIPEAVSSDEQGLAVDTRQTDIRPSEAVVSLNNMGNRNPEFYSPTRKLDFTKKLSNKGLSDPLPGDEEETVVVKKKQNPIKRLFARKKGKFDPVSGDVSQSELPGTDQELSSQIKKHKFKMKIGKKKSREVLDLNPPSGVGSKLHIDRMQDTLATNNLHKSHSDTNSDINSDINITKHGEATSKGKCKTRGKITKENIIVMKSTGKLLSDFGSTSVDSVFVPPVIDREKMATETAKENGNRESDGSSGQPDHNQQQSLIDGKNDEQRSTDGNSDEQHSTDDNSDDLQHLDDMLDHIYANFASVDPVFSLRDQSHDGLHVSGGDESTGIDVTEPGGEMGVENSDVKSSSGEMNKIYFDDNVQAGEIATGNVDDKVQAGDIDRGNIDDTVQAGEIDRKNIDDKVQAGEIDRRNIDDKVQAGEIDRGNIPDKEDKVSGNDDTREIFKGHFNDKVQAGDIFRRNVGDKVQTGETYGGDIDDKTQEGTGHRENTDHILDVSAIRTENLNDKVQGQEKGRKYEGGKLSGEAIEIENIVEKLQKELKTVESTRDKLQRQEISVESPCDKLRSKEIRVENVDNKLPDQTFVEDILGVYDTCGAVAADVSDVDDDSLAIPKESKHFDSLSDNDLTGDNIESIILSNEMAANQKHNAESHSAMKRLLDSSVADRVDSLEKKMSSHAGDNRLTDFAVCGDHHKDVRVRSLGMANSTATWNKLVLEANIPDNMKDGSTDSCVEDTVTGDEVFKSDIHAGLSAHFASTPADVVKCQDAVVTDVVIDDLTNSSVIPQDGVLQDAVMKTHEDLKREDVCACLTSQPPASTQTGLCSPHSEPEDVCNDIDTNDIAKLETTTDVPFHYLETESPQNRDIELAYRHDKNVVDVSNVFIERVQERNIEFCREIVTCTPPGAGIVRDNSQISVNKRGTTQCEIKQTRPHQSFNDLLLFPHNFTSHKDHVKLPGWQTQIVHDSRLPARELNDRSRPAGELHDQLGPTGKLQATNIPHNLRKPTIKPKPPAFHSILYTAQETIKNDPAKSEGHELNSHKGVEDLVDDPAPNVQAGAVTFMSVECVKEDLARNWSEDLDKEDINDHHPGFVDGSSTGKMSQGTLQVHSDYVQEHGTVAESQVTDQLNENLSGAVRDGVNISSHVSAGVTDEVNVNGHASAGVSDNININGHVTDEVNINCHVNVHENDEVNNCHANDDVGVTDELTVNEDMPKGEAETQRGVNFLEKSGDQTPECGGVASQRVDRSSSTTSVGIINPVFHLPETHAGLSNNDVLHKNASTRLLEGVGQNCEDNTQQRPDIRDGHVEDKTENNKSGYNSNSGIYVEKGVGNSMLTTKSKDGFDKTETCLQDQWSTIYTRGMSTRDTSQPDTSTLNTDIPGTVTLNVSTVGTSIRGTSRRDISTRETERSKYYEYAGDKFTSDNQDKALGHAMTVNAEAIGDKTSRSEASDSLNKNVDNLSSMYELDSFESVYHREVDKDNIYDEISEDIYVKDVSCLTSKRFQFPWKKKEKKLDKRGEINDSNNIVGKEKVKVKPIKGKPVIKPKPIFKVSECSKSRPRVDNDKTATTKRRSRKGKRKSGSFTLPAEESLYHEIDEDLFSRHDAMEDFSSTSSSTSDDDLSYEPINYIEKDGGNKDGEAASRLQETMNYRKSLLNSADSLGYEIPAKFSLKAMERAGNNGAADTSRVEYLAEQDSPSLNPGTEEVDGDSELGLEADSCSWEELPVISQGISWDSGQLESSSVPIDVDTSERSNSQTILSVGVCEVNPPPPHETVSEENRPWTETFVAENAGSCQRFDTENAGTSQRFDTENAGTSQRFDTENAGTSQRFETENSGTSQTFARTQISNTAYKVVSHEEIIETSDSECSPILEGMTLVESMRVPSAIQTTECSNARFASSYDPSTYEGEDKSRGRKGRTNLSDKKVERSSMEGRITCQRAQIEDGSRVGDDLSMLSENVTGDNFNSLKSGIDEKTGILKDVELLVDSKESGNWSTNAGLRTKISLDTHTPQRQQLVRDVESHTPQRQQLVRDVDSHTPQRQQQVHDVESHTPQRQQQVHDVESHTPQRQQQVHDVESHTPQRQQPVHDVESHTPRRQQVHDVESHTPQRQQQVHDVDTHTLESQLSAPNVDRKVPMHVVKDREMLAGYNQVMKSLAALFVSTNDSESLDTKLDHTSSQEAKCNETHANDFPMKVCMHDNQRGLQTSTGMSIELHQMDATSTHLESTSCVRERKAESLHSKQIGSVKLSYRHQAKSSHDEIQGHQQVLLSGKRSPSNAPGWSHRKCSSLRDIHKNCAGNSATVTVSFYSRIYSENNSHDIRPEVLRRISSLPIGFKPHTFKVTHSGWDSHSVSVASTSQSISTPNGRLHRQQGFMTESEEFVLGKAVELPELARSSQGVISKDATSTSNSQAGTKKHKYNKEVPPIPRPLATSTRHGTTNLTVPPDDEVDDMPEYDLPPIRAKRISQSRILSWPGLPVSGTTQPTIHAPELKPAERPLTSGSNRAEYAAPWEGKGLESLGPTTSRHNTQSSTEAVQEGVRSQSGDSYQLPKDGCLTSRSTGSLEKRFIVTLGTRGKHVRARDDDLETTKMFGKKHRRLPSEDDEEDTSAKKSSFLRLMASLFHRKKKTFNVHDDHPEGDEISSNASEEESGTFDLISAPHEAASEVIPSHQRDNAASADTKITLSSGDTGESSVSRVTNVRPLCRLLKLNEDKTRTIELVQPWLHYQGMSFTKESQQPWREGVFVAPFVDKGSSKLLAGFLDVGDQVLEIDGLDVSTMSVDEVTLLVQTKQQMTITISSSNIDD